MLTAAAPNVLRVYGEAIRTGAGLRVRREVGGPSAPVDMPRFLGPADRTDLGVLELCRGRVLDVGCGPGRIVAALEAAGHPALGIDVTPEAVRSARSRGAWALRRDVYGHVPLQGAWGTALLLDGNIGIGGDPERLLRRLHALLAPGGRAVVETDVDRACDERGPLVVVDLDGRARSAPFPWARIGRDGLSVSALRAGFDVTGVWSDAGRDFTVLTARAVGASHELPAVS